MLWLQKFIYEQTLFISFVGVTTYYFKGSASLCKGIKLSTFTHLGSLALASLILTIVAIIRAPIGHIAKKPHGHHPAITVALKLFKCCLKVLNRFTEFVSRRAFAYMAVTGEPFCSSAYHCFLLTFKHLSKFVVAQGIALMMVGFGMLLISSLNVLCVYLILKASGDL